MVSSSSSTFNSVQSNRTATMIAGLFLVVACCAISLLVGCELFISFRSKGSQPESFVLLGGNSLINVSSSSSSSGTLQLLAEGSLQSICGNANNFSQLEIADSIPNLLGALMLLNHSDSFETVSNSVSFTKVKETLLIDLSPVLVERDGASFALIGYNQSGLLMVVARTANELKFDFVRSNESSRVILRNGIVIGCVTSEKDRRKAQAGSAWPTAF